MTAMTQTTGGSTLTRVFLVSQNWDSPDVHQQGNRGPLGGSVG